MANTDRPKGYRPYGETLRVTPYTAGGTVYPGDVVHMETDGLVDAAAASEAVLGVAATYAVSGEEVLVWDDPAQKFIAQADDGTTLAQTDVGLNYNIVATAGNATYKQSRMEVDSDSGATDSNLPLRLVQFDREQNRAIGEFASCIVVINNHQLNQATTGA